MQDECSFTFTFTFMHLADAFIQSDLHCIQVTLSTFYQLLLSLGIEPMILALLTPCSTSWATGKHLNLFLWTKSSSELGKAVFNFLSPYQCYSYKYDHARCGRGIMLHLKYFIIWTLQMPKCAIARRSRQGNSTFVKFVLLWLVCCDSIIINGMSCWPNICDFSDWLLGASFTLSFVTDRQTDRHAGSSPDGVDLGQITQISPCHLSLLRFTSAFKWQRLGGI